MALNGPVHWPGYIYFVIQFFGRIGRAKAGLSFVRRLLL